MCDLVEHRVRDELVLGILEDEADPRRQRARVRAADVETADADGAAGRRDDACDRLDESRLAGAVRADDRDELSRSDVEVDVVQHGRASAAEREVAHLDERLRRSLSEGRFDSLMRLAPCGSPRPRRKRAGAPRSASSAACSSAGVSGSGSSAKPARRRRSAASADDRQPDAHGVQLVGATAQHLVDGAVGGQAALLVEHDDAVDEADGRVEVVLDEQDRSIALGDELGEGVVDLLDAPAGRGWRSVRRARAAASPSRGRRRSRVAAGRRPRGGRGSRSGAPTGRPGAAPPRRERAPSATGIRRFSGPKATSSRSVPVTSCASGSWKTMRDARAELRDGRVGRCRRRRLRRCRRPRRAPRAG